MPIFVFTMTDPGVHDPDPIVHDGPILLFTMNRSARSRWGDTRTHPHESRFSIPGDGDW